MFCPFCDLDNIESRILQENEFAISFLAKDAVHPGQALVIPKRHVESYHLLTTREVIDINALVQSHCAFLTSVLKYEGYNIACNNGSVAGQTVTHTHIHLIPRMQSDTVDPKLWLNAELFNRLYTPTVVEIDQIVNMRKSFPSSQRENFEIGHNSFIYPGVTLGLNVVIENNVKIGANCKNNLASVFIGDNAIIRSGTVIYDNVTIGNNFDCGHNVVIRENTKIGDNTYVLPNTQIHKSVRIGDDCRLYGFICNRARIGSHCTVFGNLVHKYSTHGGGRMEKPPTIKDNVIIGISSNIVGGITIDSNCIVGAGITVTKSLKDGTRLVRDT